MQRSLSSYSRFGKTLEKMQLRNDGEEFRKASRKFKRNPLTVHKSSPKIIQTFNVTGRDKPNSFQMSISKKINSQAVYDVKETLIHPRTAFFPLRKEQSDRLASIMINSKTLGFEQSYNRSHFDSNIKEDRVLTTRDLQNSRKSFHSLDFRKQTSRSHSYIKKPIYKEE